MNLRNYPGEYSIGLDMGTGSVGWSVVDEKGNLLHFKKKPTWGSRLFDSAMPASEARVHRGQRRRYERRRWRLDLLQGLFKNEMDKVDPEFFMRLNQSRTIEGDPIFTKSFTKADYYDRFPTIYHLRAYLMESNEPADLRLIYLAMHNIIKHRGNFLREEEKSLSAKHADSKKAVTQFVDALKEWCFSRGYEFGKDPAKSIEKCLSDSKSSRSQLASEIAKALAVSTDAAAADKKLADNLAKAMVGLQCEFKYVFGEFDCESTKLALSDDEKLELLRAACPDDSAELLDALCAVYSAYVLQGLLSYAPGQTISHNMITKYDLYKTDLKTLRALVREYAPGAYDEFFRGATYHDANPDDSSKDYSYEDAEGYTAYNLHKLSYDDFAKAVKKLLGGTDAVTDERYLNMMERFEKQQFLRRLKTSDNGAIYYQLHLEELTAIIKNQGRFYSFLKEYEGKFESLVSFRIPYYVGPLTSVNAAQDSHNHNRFQWSERKPGMEREVITPWNWDTIIDKNKSAENFIMRMTGDCTYLAGEKVLPKQSLLYEEFCVLNELNGVRWSDDGDDWQRFDTAQREGIVRELFHKYRRVTYKMLEDWLVREGDANHPIVKGGQGETGLESKMGSYLFFAKDIFGLGELSPAEYPAIEKMIKWNTLFEDRSILKEKLEDEFGERGNGMLDASQIKAICKKRFTGWGRLSEQFLTGLKVESPAGRAVSIMDVLREGNPCSERRQGETVVMMEALRDEGLGFQKKIDEHNRNYYGQHGKDLGVNELPGSPAIRRSLNQAIRIVEEIASIAGHAPANIFIEVTRGEDAGKKGKRTVKRWDKIGEALKKLKEEGVAVEVMDDFKEQKAINANLDERLSLYLMQNGKCLYSGKAINLEKLLAGSGEYEVDHIIPRAYIKDDSIENKALVLREENQHKTDQLLIDKSIRWKMRETWSQLHDAGLIGDKKYHNLLRSNINENQLRGFIARQLVETSQMVKLAQALLEARFANEETRIVPVKASMSHNLREAADLAKCREANDFHHAHDAFLASRIGLFVQMRHPGIYENPIGYSHVIKKYVQEQSEVFKKTHRMPGSAGFVINSFMSSGFDKDTGEVFKDSWDAEAEVDGIRKALNYRQCYISRMPQQDTGAFWNATVYSPRDPKMGPKLALSTKQGLDPKLYGGFSSQQFAYFFIYEAKKKGKPTFCFSQVPVWLAARIEANPLALEEYARGLAKGEGLEFVSIQRPKIYKKQLIEVNGDKLIITGAKEVRSGAELAFNQDEMSAISMCSKLRAAEAGLDGAFSEEVSAIWNRISNAPVQSCGRLLRQLTLPKYQSNFDSSSNEEKAAVVLGLIALLNGNNRIVDLSGVGGSSHAGAMMMSYPKLLDDPKVPFFIIDQSVTGMFERKTRVGL